MGHAEPSRVGSSQQDPGKTFEVTSLQYLKDPIGLCITFESTLVSEGSGFYLNPMTFTVSFRSVFPSVA